MSSTRQHSNLRIYIYIYIHTYVCAGNVCVCALSDNSVCLWLPFCCSVSRNEWEPYISSGVCLWWLRPVVCDCRQHHHPTNSIQSDNTTENRLCYLCQPCSRCERWATSSLYQYVVDDVFKPLSQLTSILAWANYGDLIGNPQVGSNSGRIIRTY